MFKPQFESIIAKNLDDTSLIKQISKLHRKCVVQIISTALRTTVVETEDGDEFGYPIIPFADGTSGQLVSARTCN